MINQYLASYILIFALSLVVSLAVTPLARRLGTRRDIADRPGGRRQHHGVIPRLGGIAMYAGFTVAVLATVLLPQRIFPPSLDPKEMTRLIGLLVGTTAVFIFGLLDDRYQFPSRPQYIAQFVSALIALVFVIFIERINNPFSPSQIVFSWPIVAALTIFWFMGMINTVNWLDGLDGLAAGVSAIMAAFLTIHMIREGQLSVALLPVALLGATIGFLPHNFNPAKIFMGSSGSYFLGWALAALGIMGGAKVATVLLAMGLPIMDVAWLIYHRWKRGGRPGFNGRDHLHHRLLDIGFTQRQIVLAYYAWCVVFGTAALVLENRLYKLIAMIVLFGAALVVLYWASKQPVGKYHNGKPNGTA